MFKTVSFRTQSRAYWNTQDPWAKAKGQPKGVGEPLRQQRLGIAGFRAGTEDVLSARCVQGR